MKNIQKFCLVACCFLGGTISAAADIEQDRAAILAMAGKHKVDFKFYETFSTNADYEIKEKVYKETAHELVKVVEDKPNRIVLQHILQVDDGLEVMIVKHWAQIWTFEDTEILEYQKGTTWKKKTLAKDAVKGTWSQLVTQIDDSPRYESYGAWNHTGGTSQWVSKETARPLPRREYKVRSDYDLIMGVNTHTVGPRGWLHEQANRKLIKRDGKLTYLAHERGINTYTKVEHDFADAEKYWARTADFWNMVRHYWEQKESAGEEISYEKKVNGRSFIRMAHSLIPEEGKVSVTKKQLDEKLGAHITVK